MIAHDVERTTALRSGVRVLACVDDLVRSLEAAGHTVRVDDDHVTVTPAINGTALFILDSNWTDVAALLADRTIPGIDWASLERDIAAQLCAVTTKRRRARRR